MKTTLENVTVAQVPREGGCTECPFCEPGPGSSTCLLRLRIPFCDYQLGIPNLQRPGRKPEWCPLLAGKVIIELV